VAAATLGVACGFWFMFSPDRALPDPDPAALPASDESFAHTALYFGCHSAMTADMQRVLFEKEYRNHWMTWTGAVMESSNGLLTITEGSGWFPQQAAIQLADPHAGENLIKGDDVTVRFVLTAPAGGSCRFAGTHGVNRRRTLTPDRRPILALTQF
jgi:hypothetical protein